MRKLIVVVVLVLSAPLAHAGLGSLTDADVDAVHAIQDELSEASGALLNIQKGMLDASQFGGCYGTAAHVAGDVKQSVRELWLLALTATRMRHRDDAMIVERYVAIEAAEVVETADASEKETYEIEGLCRQDNMAIDWLNSLLPKLARAKQKAAELKVRLHYFAPPNQ